MRLFILSALAILIAVPAQAQSSHAEEISSLVAVNASKFNQLAEAFGDEQYAYRPGEGVRSSSEVLMHIAGNNYWMPQRLGCSVPEDVAISGPYSSVVAFETETDRETIIAAVARSFEHVSGCLSRVTQEQLDADLDMFGTPGNGRVFLTFFLAHMSEHLGQLVAYARVNQVVPPWSS